MPSATGDSARQITFNIAAAAMKTTDETTTKHVASKMLSAPRGISRAAVRG